MSAALAKPAHTSRDQTGETVAERTTVVAARRHRTRRPLIVVTALVLATAGLACWALTLGDFEMTVAQVLTAFTGRGDEMMAQIVLEWRAPRVVAALGFGAALGLAGAIFQTITRNPLGSPDVIGFTAGSYTGVLIVMTVLGAGVASTTTGALIGAAVTAVAVYALAFTNGRINGFRLIMVGIAMTALLTAVNTWLLLRTSSEVAMSAAIWGTGSISLVDWAGSGPALVLLAIASVVLLGASGGMRQLELGDDAAHAHGVRVEGTRRLLLVVGVALTAIVTSIAGPIPFIALTAPQIAQRLTRSAGLPLVATAVTGAFLLLASDMFAQHALPGDVPVGVVTVVLGGAYLLWLLVHEARRG